MCQVTVTLVDDEQNYRLERVVVPIPEKFVDRLRFQGRSTADVSICRHVRKGHKDFDSRYPNARWVVQWPKDFF
ncbi:MAG TPA: hypothetical protein P5274_01575 [Candidatus Paceibacterota bacterium]|nr:hypothetical protein [Candidatus Paceibacterota bacterium]